MEVVNVNSLACKNEEAIYFKTSENDFRTPFSRDVDRILYSLSFQRYMDKTQVFSFKENEPNFDELNRIHKKLIENKLQ